ncbi:hypothetical protein BGZ94_006350, partial [Podila epigama]
MRHNADYGDNSRPSSSAFPFTGRRRSSVDPAGGEQYPLKSPLKVQRQPSWWLRKTPLEYYQQVPPREELQRSKLSQQ